MSTLEKQIPEDDHSFRKIIIIVSIVAAIVLGTIFYFLMRASSGIRVQPTLAGAIRAGSPEFEQYKSKIVLDEPQAEQANRALGDIVMTIFSNARNFTGKTINGLEVKGMVVDHQGKPINENTVVVIPTLQPELENNHTRPFQIRLEGMTDKDDRANIRVEITGFTFKQ